MTIKSEIKSCSLIKPNTNMKFNITALCDNTVFYQWHCKFTMCSDKN